MPRKYNLECVVIKNVKYQDSDRIYTLYSKELGKISATAKGVRKISSRRNGTLDTLNYVQANISESSKGFRYINEVAPKDSFSVLKDDLSYSKQGYYVIELIHRLIEDEEPSEEIFDLLVKTLKLLSDSKIENEIILSFFELRLLKLLGYALTFDSFVSCKKEFSRNCGVYRVNLALGGLICDDCKNGLLIPAKDAIFLNSLEKGKLLKNTTVSKETLNLIKVFIQNVLESDFQTVKAFGPI